MALRPEHLGVGFVRRNERIELWLSVSAASFVQLADGDYRMIVQSWRKVYEPGLLADRGVLRGTAAMDAVDERLPCDVAVISLPNYRGLPGFEGSPLAYAYFVHCLRHVDRTVMNECDAIVIGQDPNRFCCMGTHEWNALAAPRFIAASHLEEMSPNNLLS